MRIAHTADLHIRLYKRYKEYQHVFENFYKSLVENKVDRILIAGDLFHNKINLSPEAVNIASMLLYELSQIAPVDIIIGNHDCIINQPGRLDAISPIIEQWNKSVDINVYRKSGLYQIAPNRFYGVFAINDTDSEYPIHIPDKQPNDKFIAIYHGAINRSKTDVDYTLKTPHTMKMFSEYDFAMLGDIHRMQILRNDEDGLATAAYSGSLIQQNFGENLGKGYLIWDIPDDGSDHSVVFEEVKNDYGFYTIKLDKENIENMDSLLDDDQIPKKPYLRIFVDTADYNVLTLKSISNYVKEKLNPLSITVETNVEAISRDMAVKDLEVENVYQLPVQQRLLRDYFKAGGIPEAEIEKILITHEDFFNSSISEDDGRNKGTIWTINDIDFENTFSYGSNNSIDFNSIRGLVGMFSPNASGKSALLDTILMGFFNASSRSSRKNIADIINKSEDEANIDLDFSIDDKRFRIKRKFIRRKDDKERAYNFVDIFDITDGEEVNITGDYNVRGTEQYIRNLLGNYDEHRLTTFGLQSDLTCFIDMNQASRKDILASFLGMNIIEELYYAVHDEARALKTLIDQYKKHDYRSIYRNYDKKKSEAEAEIHDLEVSKSEMVATIGEITDSITHVKSTIKDVENGDITVEILEKNLTLAKTKCDQLTSKHCNLMSEEGVISARIDNKKNELKAFGNREELADKRVEFITKQNDVGNLRADQKLVDRDIKTHKKMSDTLKSHDWFESTEECSKCTFLSEAFKSKEKLPKLNEKFDGLIKKIIGLDKWLQDNLGAEDSYKKARELDAELKALESKLEICKLEAKNTKDNIYHSESSVEACKKAIKNYHDNEAIIEYNKSAKKDVERYTTTLKIHQTELKKIDKVISSKNIELGQLTQKLNDLISSIDTLEEVEKSFRQHSLLKEALSKNGIQLSLIKKIIPRINIEVKKILSNIPNFEIIVAIEDESQDIIIYIEDGINRRRIELGSGMEKTIGAIALRAALTNMSLLPRCNLFVIDEGFGTLDSENLNYMNMLLSYLKSIFTTVLIISHVDSLQDICDTIITVEKSDSGYSNIKIS